MTAGGPVALLFTNLVDSTRCRSAPATNKRSAFSAPTTGC